MSWRTVVISQRCKLDLRMGYMVVRGEETMRVFLDELAVVLIENCAVSMTGCLLAALTEKKVRVIFCDERRNPCAELIREYVTQIQFNDESNREGHAAKVYFNALFGMKFSRGQENPINAALNYGYSLLLSLCNREIAANGYLTQLGIHHDNVYNAFNLGSDLMEPFRIVVDRCVVQMEPEAFTTTEKRAVLAILEQETTIAHTRQTMQNAMKIYVKSVLDALGQGDISLLQFPCL